MNLQGNEIGGSYNWHLGDSVPTPDGPNAIADAMRVNSNLSRCNLCDNHVDKDGWCAIFDALCENLQNKITHWDLSKQHINAEITRALTSYMAISSTLTQVLLIRSVSTHTYTEALSCTKGLNPCEVYEFQRLLHRSTCLTTRLRLGKTSL